MPEEEVKRRKQSIRKKNYTYKIKIIILQFRLRGT